MVGTFRRGEEKRNYSRGLLPVVWVFGCDICFFAVISITPAWTRRARLDGEGDRGGGRGGGGGKDERILKLWVGMEIRSRDDEKQMESGADMTASSLESADLLLVQLHGCICIYMIPQNAVMCWDLSPAICECTIMCVPCVHVCACVRASIFTTLDDLTGAACRDVHYIK